MKLGTGLEIGGKADPQEQVRRIVDMENLPQSIAALDARKQRLLALLLKEEGIDPLRAPIVLCPRDRSGYPLSFAQERLWVIEQIEPGNIAYNIPYSMRLTGRLVGVEVQIPGMQDIQKGSEVKVRTPGQGERGVFEVVGLLPFAVIIPGGERRCAHTPLERAPSRRETRRSTPRAAFS